MKKFALFAWLAGTSIGALAQPTQQALDSFAANTGVRLSIVDNHPARCPKGAQGCFLSHLDLGMPAALDEQLAAGGFKIYFSSVSPVIQGDSDTFEVRHINGDLHLLQPRPGATLVAGKTYRVDLWGQGHFFSAFYPMPNMFVVSGKLQPRVLAATRPVTDAETGLETLPFVAPMTDEARLATAREGDATRWQGPEQAFDLFSARTAATVQPDIAIIPTPLQVVRPAGENIDLRGGVRLHLSGVTQAALRPALEDLGKATVSRLDRGPELRIRVAKDLTAADGYRLRAEQGLIAIDAGDSAGAANALRSLAQQVRFEGGSLRPLIIEDAPRLPFRGLHVDLARNFHSKQEVLQLVEQMAVYKLNKLHLHLGDDEGWRLQIRNLPELTSVGAYRCFDPSETHCLLPQLGSGPDRDSAVNGYLSQQDYRDILRAAQARNIEVIPSFDMPGHSRAAIRSMEARYRRLAASGRKAEAERFRLVEPADKTEYRSVQFYSDNTLNVCLESTYRFFDAVLNDVQALHASAGVPLKTYHIGADETAGAWAQSPACKKIMASTGRTAPQLGAMFIERISGSLARRGIAVAGWSDGLSHVEPAKMPKAVQSNIWGDLFNSAPAETSTHLRRDWKTVISVPNVLYFDVPYAPHPLERGYDWPTRGTDTFKVFSFMPENLAANASVMKDIHGQAKQVQLRAVGNRSIAGMQGQLWSETVRSDRITEHMLFPRLLALSERAWHRAAWEATPRPGVTYSFGDGQVDQAALARDWSAFAAKVPSHLQWMEQQQIFYRLAPPGARIAGGKLMANSEFAEQPIEYRLPAGTWRRYQGPVAVQAPVELRTRSWDGSRASRVVRLDR